MANQLPMFKLLTPQQTTPQAPQSGTDTMNQAANQAIQQGVHDNNVNNVMKQVANDGQKVIEAANLLGVSPFEQDGLSKLAMTRRFQDLAIGSKQAYAQALANGDQAGMEAAAQQAQVYREAADKAGIDMSSVGADRTLAQAQAARDVFNAQQYGNLVANGMDSGQMYNNEYAKAIQAGMSTDGADSYAYKKAQGYQQKRLQALQDELYTQGINPDNSINSYGIQLISAMRNESPDSADLALTTFGVPLNNYTFDKKEQAANSALARQVALMNGKYNNEAQMLGARTNSQAQLLNLQTDNQLRTMRNQAALQREMADRYGAEAVNAGGKTSGKSSSKASNGDVKLSNNQTKLVNKIDSARLTLQRLLAQPREDGQKVATDDESDAMEALNSAINDAEESGEFDTDTLDQWKEMAWALYNSYQGKYNFKP